MRVTTETAKEYGNDSNGPKALGEFDYSNYAGWMYFVNNEAPNVGITSYQPKDGDVVRFQFTVYGYGTDLSGKEWGNPTPVIEISNKDHLTSLMAEANTNKTVSRARTTSASGVKDVYDKAVKAISAMITPQEEIDKLSEELSEKLEEQQGQEETETVSVTLVNKKYGVSLQGEGLTEDMELQVEPLNKDSKDVERMRKEIQLPQKAVLSIPVGEKYNGKELVVLACSDKDIKQLKGKVANGSVSVEVTELMSFGVVVDTAASEKEVNSGNGTANRNTGGNSSGGKAVKTGYQTPMEVLVLLLTLSGAAVAITAGKKRREQK